MDTASKLPAGGPPALATRMSARPKAFVVLPSGSWTCIVAGEVARTEEHLHPVGPAQLAGKGGQCVLPARHEEEVGSLPSQGLRRGSPHPRRSPAHTRATLPLSP